MKQNKEIFLKNISLSSIIFTLIIVLLFSIGIANESLAEEFEYIFPENGNLENNKTYVLTNDTELTNNLNIDSGYTITIDLNGYVLKGNGNGAVITNKGNLTIMDSSPNRKVCYFEKSETTAWKWLPDATDDNNGEYATISGGIITGGNDQTKATASSGGGGAIKMNSNALNNILNIEGGTIVGNYTGRAGGAFYGGKVSMSGGKIIGNYAKAFSAAISISGDFTMTGGEVSKENFTGNNSTYTEDAMMVVGTNSNFIISGGKFNGIITTSTGASRNSFNMSGGEINGTVEIKNQMNTYISGGTLTGNIVMENGTCTISENALIQQGKTENGGCVMITKGTFIMDGGIIRDCEATQNGGAVNIESGTAKIRGGIIKNCSAINGGAVYVNGGDFELSGEGRIESCVADEGGAVHVSNGNVVIDKGSIDNCQATDGGNVYISGGNITLNNGIVTGGKATKGGGIYIANGNITMNGGSISYNQATEHGGGIYASSDTQDLSINITSGSIISNIANKHGGGIGVNMGEGFSAIVTVGLEMCHGRDETHSHPVIKDNTANEKGGGLCLHGDSLSMTMYCGECTSNIAIQEPGSANINQSGGTISVDGANVGDGITVIGGKYIDIQKGQAVERSVTYNSNIYDNIITMKAEISGGVKISLPKNLFTRENYVLVGWSRVQNPTDADTIYSAGGSYTVTEEDIILYAIWLRTGAGTIKEPAILSGKHYNEIDNGTNIMISCDSAFTAQMSVFDMEANLYKDRTLEFSNSLIKGTTIIMVDLTNKNERVYYYYNVNDDGIYSVALESFIQMGSNIHYSNPLTEELIDETYLFILDLPDDNTITNSTEMTLIRYSTEIDVANIEQNVAYTTTQKRGFNLVWTNRTTANASITVKDNFNISYEKENLSSNDSRYEGRSLALIISAQQGNEIPPGTQLFDGTNYYSLTSDRQFIIPLGDILTSKDMSLKLISNELIKNQQGCNLKAELWVSANENATKPFMGDKVATIDDINLAQPSIPSIKLEMNKRVYYVSDLGDNLKINYQTQNMDKYNVTLEVQKKDESDKYITQTNILKSVSNSKSDENGVYTLKVNESGDMKISFANFGLIETGTYRILIKVIEKDKIIYEIPYNFIVID